MALHRIRRIAAPPAETWPPALPGGRRSGMQSWLTDPGSLTRRLRQDSARFELRLLRQGAARALRDESALLGLPHGRKVWRRDVLLIADGVPRVLGHSVCALSALRGPWRLLRHLGVKPVGDAVFARPQTRRSAMRVRRLSLSSPLLQLADAAHDAHGHTKAGLWARRSSFVFGGEALWVSEVFFREV
ncbi:MAG: chorismate lyase [Burkholderiaceae bacterium]|nr:chorismate lyase [Burkholderiaceae bacterium]